MRKPGLFLLVSAALAVPFAARSQDAQPPATPEDYVCAFAGDCSDRNAAVPADQASPGGLTPRISATRGFAISTNTPAPRPRRPVASNVARQAAGGQAHYAFRVSERPGAANQRVDLSLNFPTGSAALTPEAAARARVFGQALLMPQLASMHFRIEGHTDGVGNRASNLALSQRRAQSVADFLVSMGVPRGRIEVHGYGPDRPLPGTARNSPRNRRVEAVRVS